MEPSSAPKHTTLPQSVNDLSTQQLLRGSLLAEVVHITSREEHAAFTAQLLTCFDGELSRGAASLAAHRAALRQFVNSVQGVLGIEPTAVLFSAAHRLIVRDERQAVGSWICETLRWNTIHQEKALQSAELLATGVLNGGRNALVRSLADLWGGAAGAVILPIPEVATSLTIIPIAEMLDSEPSPTPASAPATNDRLPGIDFCGCIHSC